MKIVIGADHAGYVLKERIKEHLAEKKITCTDFGTFKEESVHYPDFAYKVASAVSKEEADMGILICGTGIGMSITANKVKGVRASLVHNEETAQMTRLHNDANVLCLGARVTEVDLALKIVDVWLNTSFEGGRHQVRVELIKQLTGL